MDLDTLWSVEDEFFRAPQWSTTVSPGKCNTKAAGIFLEPRSSGGQTLQITDGNDKDSTSMPASIPDLETASDYSADSRAMRGRTDESEVGSLNSDGNETSEHDSEEEAELDAELHNRYREAMDMASADPEIFEGRAFEKQSDDNQLLKALGALRGKWRRLLIWIWLLRCGSWLGRLFSSNPRLRTNRAGTQVARVIHNLSTDSQGRDGTSQCHPKYPDECLSFTYINSRHRAHCNH